MRFSDERVEQVARMDTGSLTTVRSASESSKRVHVGLDEGSWATKPLCPALADRQTETTDELANCPDCKTLLRAAGHDLGGLCDVPEDYDMFADRHSAAYYPDHPYRD